MSGASFRLPMRNPMGDGRTCLTTVTATATTADDRT
jgi:hypothetical protein